MGGRRLSRALCKSQMSLREVQHGEVHQQKRQRAAAVTSESRLGPRCATFGPRSLGRRGVAVFRQRCRDTAGWAGIGVRSKESPPRPGAGRAWEEGGDATR